jgi:hypothetical protein
MKKTKLIHNFSIKFLILTLALSSLMMNEGAQAARSTNPFTKVNVKEKNRFQSKSKRTSHSSSFVKVNAKKKIKAKGKNKKNKSYTLANQKPQVIQTQLTHHAKRYSSNSQLAHNDAIGTVNNIVPTTNKNNNNNPTQNKSQHIIAKLRNNFTMKHEGTHEVQKYVTEYNQSKKSLIKDTVQATPHLHYVMGQVEKRNLPGELALLPMLESKFKQNATSNKGAAGIWQIMPGTGKRFGLKRSAGYDGRRDVQASTTAALNYLEYLHKRFKGDWMLALAAYNAGEGTVDRAIKRNRSAGKSTSFWSLKLPKQTRAYVPKFLALAQVMKKY